MFLEQAPAELAALGIELIGPERLVRAAVAVRGRATPAPTSDRTGGVGREAIVQWSLTVADEDGPTALSDAELARAEAAGATLLHTGRRWVRIDPAALRRARRQLDEHRRDHELVDALTLLRLAADAETDLGADGDGADGDADGGGWAGDLLAGLPDEALTEESEPPGFHGALRPYQRRGLSWMRFLARLGLGGCLADDMGLGKTATTLAHLLDRPGPHLVVCPLSVVHNWEAEARRFTPGLRVVVHHGAERAGRGDDGQERLEGTVDDRRRRPRRDDLRAAGPRPRAPRRHPLEHGRARRGPDGQEPRDQRGPGGAGAERRSEAGPHRARRSRTAWPSCGRSSTPSTPACSAAASASATASPSRSSATATPRPRPGCAG